MTPPKNQPYRSAAVLGTLAAFAFATSGHAALLDSWTQFSGSISSGLNTSAPVLGNGSADSADSQTIYAASASSHTLAATGDKVTLSGSVTFAGLSTPQADQFRIGIYDVNGQSGVTGWLGYFATNTGAPTGGTGPSASRLWERSSPNAGSFGSGTGAISVATANATPSNGAFASGTYTFSVSATRTATGLDLAWSFVSAGLGYSVSGTYSDATPQSYVFNRVGIFTGGSLNAAQASFADVDLSFTPAAVPEPASAAALAGLAGLALVAGRRRR